MDGVSLSEVLLPLSGDRVFQFGPSAFGSTPTPTLGTKGWVVGCSLNFSSYRSRPFAAIAETLRVDAPGTKPRQGSPPRRSIFHISRLTMIENFFVMMKELKCGRVDDYDRSHGIWVMPSCMHSESARYLHYRTLLSREHICRRGCCVRVWTRDREYVIEGLVSCYWGA